MSAALANSKPPLAERSSQLSGRRSAGHDEPTQHLALAAPGVLDMALGARVHGSKLVPTSALMVALVVLTVIGVQADLMLRRDARPMDEGRTRTEDG